MKKITCILAAILAFSLLTGCNKKTESNPKGNVEEYQEAVTPVSQKDSITPVVKEPEEKQEEEKQPEKEKILLSGILKRSRTPIIQKIVDTYIQHQFYEARTIRR